MSPVLGLDKMKRKAITKQILEIASRSQCCFNIEKAMEEISTDFVTINGILENLATKGCFDIVTFEMNAYPRLFSPRIKRIKEVLAGEYNIKTNISKGQG